MNEENSIKELLTLLRSSNYWVKKIVAAYMGVDPEKIEIVIKDVSP